MSNLMIENHIKSRLGNVDSLLVYIVPNCCIYLPPTYQVLQITRICHFDGTILRLFIYLDLSMSGGPAQLNQISLLRSKLCLFKGHPANATSCGHK